MLGDFVRKEGKGSVVRSGSLGMRCFAAEENGLEDGIEEQTEGRKSLQEEGVRVRAIRSVAMSCVAVAGPCWGRSR
jgi:hypothetical protein